MKNLFAFDIGNETEHPECEEWSKLVIRRTEDELSEKQDELSENLEEHKKNAELPSWLTIARSLCLLFFLIVLSATAKAGFGTAMRNAPGLVISGAVSGAAALVLWLIGRSKAKNVIESEDFNADVAEAEKINAESLASLGVPEDAAEVDVFTYFYELKNGKEKRKGIISDYMTMQFRAFREGEMLCLADVGGVIGIPIYNITGIHKINKRVSFMEWNKEEAFNKGEYKQYKMTSNNMGAIFIKPYYSLRFCDCGEEYEILFPAYELETFKRLTGAGVKEE